MDIPAQVKVGPLIYQVVFDPHLRDDKGQALFGQTLYSEQEIRLRPNLSVEQTKVCFLHEVLHAIEGYYRIELGEEIISRLAPILYPVLGEIWEPNHQ